MKKEQTYSVVSALQENREHEQSTNRVVGLVSVGLVVINLLTQTFLSIDYANSAASAGHQIFMLISVLIFIFFHIAAVKKFDGPWIKYMLLSGIILNTTLHFFVFTTFATYFILIPLVISTRYFDKRFVKQVSLVTVSLFVAAFVLNLVLPKYWPAMQSFHEVNVYDPWSIPEDAFVFTFIPLFLCAVFTSAYGFEMTRNGRKLMEERVANEKRVVAVDTELAMASRIQRSALPPIHFTTKDGSFALRAGEKPAKEVGGDFYDYYELNDHILAFLVADVSDKGVPAAMFMMSAKKALHCAVECCHSLEDAIILANRMICEDNESEMFLTLWMGMIDTRTGVGKYVNAGHPAPVIRHENGEVSFLTNTPDLFMGVFPESYPAVHTFRMEEGDTLVLFTDGITDAMNPAGEVFGTENLVQAVSEAGSKPDDIINRMIDRSAAFVDGREQFDDMTLLALQCRHLEPLKECVIDTLSGGKGTEQVLNEVNKLLCEVNCPEDVRRNADVVLDEQCANISEYAYDGAQGRMMVHAYAGGNYLRLVFVDEGDAFNPLEQEDPQFGDEPSVGGLGIFFMKNLTDSRTYRRVDNRNEQTVEMIWNI